MMVGPFMLEASNRRACGKVQWSLAERSSDGCERRWWCQALGDADVPEFAPATLRSWQRRWSAQGGWRPSNAASAHMRWSEQS